MAATFEEQALDQLTEDARRALRQGADPEGHQRNAAVRGAGKLSAAALPK